MQSGRDGMKADPSSMVVLGRINGAHGIKGWNKLDSFTAQLADIGNYKKWFMRQSEHHAWREVEWDELRWQGKRLVVRMQGCTERNHAENIAGSEIAVPRSELPELREDDYYWHELIGLVVQTNYEGQLKVLGVVSSLMETGANDVIVVQGKGCEAALDQRERLIPYLPGQVVLDVDLKNGTLLVDWDAEF